MPSGEKTMFSEMRQGILVDASRTFDLSQIVNSGQCFRLVEYPHRNYVAVTGNHMVDISYISLTDSYLFRCSRRDFEISGILILILIPIIGFFRRKCREICF